MRPTTTLRAAALAAALFPALAGCQATSGVAPAAPAATPAPAPISTPATPAPDAAAATAAPAAPTTPPAPAPVRYAGVLPCVDCSGIRMELTLFPNKTFSLRQTYLGKPGGDQVFESMGPWDTRQGSADDPKATVYQLKPGDEFECRSFLKVDDRQLLMLNRKLQKIASEANYTLTRVDG